MTVRQALIDKYNSTYPYRNKALPEGLAPLVERRVARSRPKWNKCPGNRRYITYMFDAMIGQANGAPRWST